MSDLNLALKDLRAAARSIFLAADKLEAAFSSPVAVSTSEETAPTAPDKSIREEATTPIEESAPEETANEKSRNPISIDDVRTVLAALSNDGKKSAVKKLLAKYGSSRLSEIDPKNYAALLKDAEEVKNAG